MCTTAPNNLNKRKLYLTWTKREMQIAKIKENSEKKEIKQIFKSLLLRMEYIKQIMNALYDA